MATINDLALRLLISAKDETAPGVKSARQGIKSISQELQQVETLARRFLDIRLFANWARDGLTLADAYKTLQGRLKIVSDSTQEYATAEDRLFAIAQRTRSSLEATYNVYGKLAVSIRQLGGNQERAFQTTETLNKAIALTSQGAAEDAGAILQFSQALGSGVLAGDEFRSVMENSPGLAQALADGLNVPIGKLKEMSQAGQLTADRLINALGKSGPKVAEQFDKLPVTVAGAMNQVNNALTTYIGHSNGANSASARLAGFLQAVARHFDTVANVAQTLATIYLVRVVQGWLKSAQAAIAAAAASREKAAADAQAQAKALELAQSEVTLTAIRVKAAQAMVVEAQLQRALAVGADQQKLANNALAAAMAKLHAMESKATAANEAMAIALSGTTTKMSLQARATEILGRAFNALFSGWIAFDLGQTFGEWLRQFEAVRQAGSYLAETLVMIQTGAQAMLNGSSFADRWAQIKQIHAEFEQLRANETGQAEGAAQTVSQAESQKAQAAEQAALKMAESFAKVKAATEALTAQIDADAKTQTAAIQQSLADRLAAIEASNISDAGKDRQRIAAKLQAAQAELALQQQTEQLKLQLIDQEYAAEEKQAQANADRLQEVETAKRQAKLAVYQGVAEFYTAEVAKLSELYGQETAAFAQSKQTMQQAAIDHQQALLALDRQGMTERQKLASEQDEYDKTRSALKAELAKGDQASQSTINTLLERAKALQGELTQAAINSAETQGQKSVAIYEAKKRENEVYDLQKQVLETNAAAHEENARRVQAGLDSARTELDKANASIKEMSAELGQQYLLKIGVDKESLGQVQAAIADLIKPETKIITIQTQNSDAAAAPGQASGGMAGLPSGQPWRFSSGGWARVAGLLSGYGGGDRRRALLEDGEFVVRKEAVRQLGVPVLQAVNQGQLPTAAGVIQAAGGGLIDEETEKRFRQRGVDQLKQLMTAYTYENANRWMAGNHNNEAGNDLASQIIGLGQRLQLPTGVVGQALAAAKRLPRAYPNSGNDNQIKNRAVREGLSYQAAIDALGSTDTAKATRPAFKLPALPEQLTAKAPAGGAGGAVSSSQLLEGARGGGSLDRVVTVKFQPPRGGAPIAGTFAAGDINQLLETLKDAAGRGLVGVS